MAYGEMPFEEENIIVEGHCDLCGGTEFHEPECPLQAFSVEDSEESGDEIFSDEQ